MDREELNKILEDCPIRITMNDGSSFEVPSKEMALCSDIKLTLLHKAKDGKWRDVYLPLVKMAKIEAISATSN